METSDNDDGGTLVLGDSVGPGDSSLSGSTRTESLTAAERTGTDHDAFTGGNTAGDDRLSRVHSPGGSSPTRDTTNNNSSPSPRDDIRQSPQLLATGNEQRQRVTSFSVADILRPTKFPKTELPPRTSGDCDRELGTGIYEEESTWHSSSEPVALARTPATTRELENIFRTGES